MSHRQNKIPFYFSILSVSSPSACWNLLKSNCIRKAVYTTSTDQSWERLAKHVTFIPQPLAGGKAGIEIWYSDSEPKVLSKQTAVCDSPFGKWAFISGIKAPKEMKFRDQVRHVLQKMEALLKEVDFRFQDLIRTWFYIGDILKKEGNDARYDLLNKVRNEFYAKVWSKEEHYPASTGIGMQEDGLIMEGIALKPSCETSVIRLENPLQKSAFKYEIPEEKRPKFCRAVYVGNADKGIIFVSGTASIRGEDVCFPSDIKRQTCVTIENIEALISKDNLKRYGINWNLLLKDVSFIKVYLKEKEYYSQVKNICNQYFGNIPQLYLIAEICRAELLVEIEAVITKP